MMEKVFVETVRRDKFIVYRTNSSKNLSQSAMDGKICQNIKPSTPTHIPFSVQLSICGRLEDWTTYIFCTFCYMLIVLEQNKI